MSRPAELLRGPRHRHRRSLGAGSPGGRLRGRRRSGPREQQPGWAPVSVRRHSRPHHGPARDDDGPALRRADGHRGAAQGAVIVYVGPHRAAVRGTLLIRRASVTRFGCRPCPEAGLSLHRVWKLWSFLSVELWHRVAIDGDGGGKDVASRIPRNPTRASRRPRDGMTNGTWPRGEISRDQGDGGPRSGVECTPKGFSPSARPMARGPVWTFPFIIRRSIQSQLPRWGLLEMIR